MLEGVRADRRAFRDDLLREYARAVRLGGTALALTVTGVLLSGLFALKTAVAAVF